MVKIHMLFIPEVPILFFQNFSEFTGMYKRDVYALQTDMLEMTCSLTLTFHFHIWAYTFRKNHQPPSLWTCNNTPKEFLNYTAN